MDRPFFLVDAFTSEPFRGNPAGVCLLDGPAEDKWMQSVAAEMRHSETAFLYPDEGGYALRWFTPNVEVDLCGHATLASAHILFGRGDAAGQIQFQTRSGLLTAENDQDGIALDFPIDRPSEIDLPIGLAAALGAKPIRTSENRQAIIAEFETQHEIQNLRPDFDAIESFGRVGVIVTAPSENNEWDFVSRFFAPQAGVPEDPATGSAHCGLAPYWSDRLGKTAMTGYQCSARGGEIKVAIAGDRVRLTGKAVTILEGTLKC